MTVQRIADGLENLDVETEIISITENSSVTALPPSDITHGFHAYKFYKFKEHLKTKIESFVVTMTGTDLNHDLYHQDKRADVIQCLSEAKAIHVFNEEAKQVLVKEAPNMANKIYVIPQGATLFKETDFSIEKEENTFLFVLPAGIRKVKNVPFAINMLKTLYEKYPSVRLLLVGPVIEEDEGQIVKNLVDQNKDWVSYIGQIPHSNMGAIYKQADALLNTSHTEGQPSAIIEAMAYSLPVLVSSNHGNLSLVFNEKTGFVYNNEVEFLDYAEQLVNNNEIREKLGEAAQAYIEKYHSSTSEVQTLLKIYQDVLKERLSLTEA